MNYSPAYILSQYLIDEGLAVEPSDSGDWPIFVASLPDGDEIPDDAIASIDTAGVKDGRLNETGENIIHYGVQIIVRSEIHDYLSGYTKAQAIESKLETVDRNEVMIDSGNVFRLDNVSTTSGVVAIGQEEENSKRRNLFSCNFLVTLKEI